VLTLARTAAEPVRIARLQRESRWPSPLAAGFLEAIYYFCVIFSAGDLA